jgi:hypothetical protein
MSNLQNYQHQIPRYVRTAIGSTIPKTTIADHRCYKPSINLSIYQSINLSLYLSISLSMSLSLYLSIYLSTYLSIFLSFFLYFFLSFGGLWQCFTNIIYKEQHIYQEWFILIRLINHESSNNHYCCVMYI